MEEELKNLPGSSWQKLSKLLSNAGKYVSRMRTAHGTILFLAVFWLAGLLILLGNALFFVTESTRAILFFAWITLGIFLLAWFAIRPSIRRVSNREAAILYEKNYPELETRLVASWDLLKDRGSNLGYSTNLIDIFSQKAYDRAKDLDHRRLFPKKAIRKTGRYLSILVIITLGLMTLAPSFYHDGWFRMMHPFEHISRPTETVLSIIPGNYETVKYSDVVVTAKALGIVPDEVEIYRKLEQGSPVNFPMQKEEDRDEFVYEFKDVRHSFEYYVEGGDFTSSSFKVTVIDNPRIIDIKVTYTYPGYTGLGTQLVEQNDGNIDALYGTKIKIEALSNKKLREAKLVFSDSTAQKMAIQENRLSGGFAVREDGSYHLECVDNSGNQNSDPIEYQVRMKPDDYPIVQIIHPGEDVDLTEDMVVPIELLAEDDYGFSKFNLVYTKLGSKDTNAMKLDFSEYGKSKVILDFVWSLNKLGLLPNDVVTYWIAGYDNDDLRGPKRGESKKYSVRFPSMEEVMDEIAKEQDMQERDIKEVFKEGEKLREQLEQISRELMKEQEIDWERKEELENLLKKQEDVAKKLEKISQDMETTLEKIESNQLVTMEIFQKMQEIQKILEEVATPEMLEAMDQIQEALKNMDPKALEDAIKKLKMDQDKLLEKLDRTLALLRRMQIERELSELIKMAIKAEENQQEVNEALENVADEDLQELSKKQDDIGSSSEYMQKKLQELAEKMKEFKDMPSKEAGELADKMSSDSLGQQSSKMCSMMGQCNKKGAKKSGQKLEQDLAKLREELQKLQNKMNAQLKEEIMAALRKAIYDLLHLSRNQEDYFDTTKSSGFEERTIQQVLQNEIDLKESLSKIANLVYSLASKTFLISPQVGASIGEGLSSIKEAMEALSNRRGQQSLPSQQGAMAHINQAALGLMSSMNAMNQSSSCSGADQFFSMMESMCQKQCGLNQQTIPLAGMQPGGMNPDKVAAAARLAAEQEQVKKSLEEMQREYGEYKNILGRFDNTIEDMEKVIDDLNKENVDHRTLERQERILSRMLDAQKSLHKRNYTKKRQSETGKDMVRKSPPQLPENLEEQRNLIQQAMIRALNQPYPREYESMIRAYFKALGQNLDQSAKTLKE
ncbi:hypothetical protein JXI42_00260 [bacterium]|nr:hypothetical protein [bacterium]